MRQRLRKSRTDKVLFGVCGGLGEHLNIDSVLVRAAFVALAFASGVGVVAYIALAFLMPSPVEEESQPAPETRDVGEVGGTPLSEAGSSGTRVLGDRVTQRTRNTAGLILVVVGLAFLLANLNFFWWFDWGVLWPLVLIVIGGWLLLGRFRRS